MRKEQRPAFESYRNLVGRTQHETFYGYFGDRYEALAYVAGLTLYVAIQEAVEQKLTQGERTNAWRIGEYWGIQKAQAIEYDEDTLAGVDKVEGVLAYILKDHLGMVKEDDQPQQLSIEEMVQEKYRNWNHYPLEKQEELIYDWLSNLLQSDEGKPLRRKLGLDDAERGDLADLLDDL